MTFVATTERLALRRLTPEDAPFILELVNTPTWLQFIGDRNVHSLDDARQYILKGPVEAYKKNGTGLYHVSLKEDGAPVGMCGLLKRDILDDLDIGFALLPAYEGKGYAYEAAQATLAHGREDIGLKRVVAFTTAENERSVALISKLGMRFERNFRFPGEENELLLFGVNF
jgi:RimJ/RimL family protein N-acetyltransferase